MFLPDSLRVMTIDKYSLVICNNRCFTYPDRDNERASGMLELSVEA